MKRGSVFVVTALGALLFSGHAQAFEREWHLGGGLGVTAYPRYYSLGPALGLNAAYGISDVFDFKLELLGSPHDYAVSARLPSEHAQAYSALTGLSYKLDVLQWIPYGALLVGYGRVSGALPVGEPFRRDDALASLVLGLDYAMTRSFGLGVSLRTDMRLSTPSEGEAVTTLLRAEYHWGF